MKMPKQFSSPSAAVVLLVLLGMSPPAAVKAKSTPLEPAVRKLVEDNCGRCHNSTRETAKPAALKVFDLKEADWTASMSDARLPIVIQRLKSGDVAPEKLRQAEEFIKGKLEERATRKH